MADVQLEHGFTKIANELLEHMATIKLSPIQYRLIFVIWRYTYGFNRKEHKFSLSFLGNATGYDQRQLQRELAKLEERNIISQKVRNGVPRIISFNKNFDKWVDDDTFGNSTEGKSTIGKTTIGNPTKGTLGKNVKGTFGNSTKEEINNFGFEQPEQLIEEAIKDAARGNGKTWKFVYKKLCSWRKKGIATLADLESEDDTSGGSKKYRSGNGRAPKKSSESITGNQVGWIGKRD